MAKHAVDKFEAGRSEFLHLVDHALRSALAVEAHDIGCLGQPIALVFMQRLHRVVAFLQPVGETARIEDRLRAPLEPTGYIG